MNPFSLIGDLLKAVAGVFGYFTKRSDLNNAPDMQKRAMMQKENEQNDNDAKDIKVGDLDSIRNKLS